MTWALVSVIVAAATMLANVLSALAPTARLRRLGAWAGAAGVVLTVGALVMTPAPSGDSAEIPRPLVVLQQLLVAVTVAWLAAEGLRLLVRVRRTRSWTLARRHALFAAPVVLALALRGLYPHAFLHAEHFGLRLLSDIMAFPEPATFRASWGQTSFTVFGAVASLTGSWTSVFVVSALSATASVALWGVLAHRWGGAVASVAVMTALALHPGLVRVGCSEDAHNIALLLYPAALLAVDCYARDTSSRALVTGQLLVALLLWTRESAFLLLPTVPFLLVVRGGWRLLRRPEVWAAAATVVTAGGLHLAAICSGAGEVTTPIWQFVARVPELFLSEPNPLVDPFVSPPPLFLLALLGVALAPGGRGMKALLLCGLLVPLVFSGPFYFGGPGIQISFRSGLLTLAAVAAGLGAAGLWAWRRRLLGRAVVVASAALYVSFAGFGLARLAVPDPVVQEVRFLERAIDAIPPGATIVTSNPGDTDAIRSDSTPTVVALFPRFLAQRAGATVLYQGDWQPYAASAACALYYRSVFCNTLSLGEASDAFLPAFQAWERAPAGSASALFAMTDLVAGFDSHPPSVPPSRLAGQRTACREPPETRGPLYAGLEETLALPSRYRGLLFYPDPVATVGFYEIPGHPCPARGTPR